MRRCFRLVISSMQAPAGSMQPSFWVDFDGAGRVDHIVEDGHLHWKRHNGPKLIGPHAVTFLDVGGNPWLGFHKTDHARGVFSTLYVDRQDAVVLSHGLYLSKSGRRISADIVRGALCRTFTMADFQQFAAPLAVLPEAFALLDAAGRAWRVELHDAASGRLTFETEPGQSCELFVLGHGAHPSRFILAVTLSGVPRAIVVHCDSQGIAGWALSQGVDHDGKRELFSTVLRA